LAGLVLVIHERLANWARQLRPRLASWPIRLIETRSTSDLEGALARTACPIVVLDVGSRPRAGLEDLDRAIRAAPNALTLVLDPRSHEGVAALARELGATHVISGPVTPPALVDLLARWLPLARRQTERDGWSSTRGDQDPSDLGGWLAPFLSGERSPLNPRTEAPVRPAREPTGAVGRPTPDS
jgi:DNA-binding NtrC family response regulator